MSEVDWQIAPCAMSWRRSVRPLVKLPLWRDGDAADFELGKQRLHVAEDRLAGRRVAHVAHRHVAGDAREGRGVGEMVADEAELALGVELAAVEADDARRFLAAMLQRVEAERRERRGVGVAQNAEHPALFAQGVAVEIVECFVSHEIILGSPCLNLGNMPFPNTVQ